MRPRGESDDERCYLFDGVITVLRAAAAAYPLLIVLDDIHAADASSLLLLGFVRDLLLHWAGLDAGDEQMLDHVRCTRELVRLRWRHPALRGQGFRVVHVHDANRVLAFQRWVEGEGHDVVVVAHLSTFTRSGYRIGFPSGGDWREVFNSDVYENWVNPHVAGNGGRVFVEPHPLHGFRHSAALVLPANSLLVFAR